MTPLFSDVGRQALRRFLTTPPLCLFDFDGTLAPLVDDPSSARLPLAVKQRLQRLQRRVPVGIITGRSLKDIRQRLAFEPDYVVGNHGLEGLPGWRPDAMRQAARCRLWREALSGLIQGMDPGLHIEDKTYSLTVHYRHAADPLAVRQVLQACVSTLQPSPRVIPGKFSLNLLPADAGDKGHAVQQLLARSGRDRALYVGDDDTDEEVFMLRHSALFSVRVGADVTTAADYVLNDHHDVETLLEVLLFVLAETGNATSIPVGQHRQ